MLAQTNLGEFYSVLIAGGGRRVDEFIVVPNLGLFDAGQIRAGAKRRIHRSRGLPRIAERSVRGPFTQVWEHRAERRWSCDGVNERDSRIDVARVAKKDARESSPPVG